MEMFLCTAVSFAIGMVIAFASQYLRQRLMKRPAQKVAMRSYTPAERHAISSHEAGHATIALILMPDLIDRVFVRHETPIEQLKEDDGNDPSESLLIGGALVPKQLNLGQQTRSLCRSTLVMAYGGLHGEQIAIGEHSLGVRGDLKRAALHAGDFIDHFGLPGKEPIFYEAFIRGLKVRHDERERELWEASERLLTEVSQEARSILAREDALFRAIADALYAKGNLNREELLALRDKHLTTKA